MSVLLGQGEFKYKVVEDWAKLPENWFFMDVAGVAVNSKDEVYVFNRGEHPMIVFDIDGNYLRSWGENLFSRPHGIHIGPDDYIYCTDDGDHTVKKLAPDGKLIFKIGIPGKPSEFMSNLPFHRCTHTALCPDNNIFVSDGYGNACVHKYSPDGKLIKTFGESGTGPGQFNLVHNIVADEDGWDAKRLSPNKSRGRWVPQRVASGLKRVANPATGERRSVGFLLNQQRTVKFFDCSTVRRWRDETVVFLRGASCQGLEPVRVVRCASADGPLLHCRRGLVGHLAADRSALFHRLNNAVVGLVRQV